MSLHTAEKLLEWIQEKNDTVHVSIYKNKLSGSDFWFYNKGFGGCGTQKWSMSKIGYRVSGGDRLYFYKRIKKYGEISKYALSSNHVFHAFGQQTGAGRVGSVFDCKRVKG